MPCSTCTTKTVRSETFGTERVFFLRAYALLLLVVHDPHPRDQER
jgi:hypothetical protein